MKLWFFVYVNSRRVSSFILKLIKVKHKRKIQFQLKFAWIYSFFKIKKFFFPPFFWKFGCAILNKVLNRIIFAEHWKNDKKNFWVSLFKNSTQTNWREKRKRNWFYSVTESGGRTECIFVLFFISKIQSRLWTILSDWAIQILKRNERVPVFSHTLRTHI